MTEERGNQPLDKCFETGPFSNLEKKYYEEYLRSKGYRPEDLSSLPPAQARRIAIEACKYASLKLAEIESRAKFRDKIRQPS